MISVGVLGCGNMGGAILRAWADLEDWRGRVELLAHDLCPERCALAGVRSVPSAADLAREADWLILALKPKDLPKVLQDLAPLLTPDKLLISIAAGLGSESVKRYSGGRCPVILVMPNTPAMVCQGLFGICLDDPLLQDEQRRLARDLFSSLGKISELPESSLAAFSALYGCGPAYIYYFLDALVEAGVHLGFARQETERLVLALGRGSVALAESGADSLPILREKVCSPGGTTIEAMQYMDLAAVRGHIVRAVLAAWEKGKATQT